MRILITGHADCRLNGDLQNDCRSRAQQSRRAQPDMHLLTNAERKQRCQMGLRCALLLLTP